MSLTRYQRLAYRLFGSSVANTAQTNAHLRMSLQKAHIYQRPEVYLGYSLMNMTLAFGVCLAAIVVLVSLYLTQAVPLPASVLAVVVPLPLVAACTIYLLTFVMPDIRAGQRARDIDAKLPYALNYVATMAGAGVTPEKIFKGLAAQPIYGEVANEAALISRDLRLLGKDLVSALSAAVDRSPSAKWQDLMQGAIAAMTSGGDLKRYFRTKAEQFQYDNRQVQKQFLESLGVLAETFVVVVVAAPLFLIVLLSIMSMFGGNVHNGLTIGWAVVLVLLPVAQIGFGAAIKASTPEV